MVELRLEAPGWLSWAWVSWCLALGLCLWFGCALEAGYRLALLAGVAWFGVRGYTQLRPRGHAGRLRWEADGRWWLDRGPGFVTYVQPDPPRRLGAMIWVRWRSRPGGRYFHADGIVVEPKALPALKARTHFSGPSRRRSTP